MIEIRNEKGELVEVRLTAQDFIDRGVLSGGGIILPGHPLYAQTLGHSLPPGFAAESNQLLICRSGNDVLESVNESDFSEYFYGGEYEQRESEVTEN